LKWIIAISEHLQNFNVVIAIVVMDHSLCKTILCKILCVLFGK